MSVDVPIKVSMTGGDEAASQAADIGTNWDKAGLEGVHAARSLTNGISGLLSAEQNIYNAQQRVNVAQINYTLTVREYGAGSIQATKALTQLQQAQESVKIAQDQLDLRFLQFALTTGPQVFTALQRMMAATEGLTLSQYQLQAGLARTAILAGITIGILTLGIGVFTGLMAGAATTNTVNQTNNFNGMAATSPGSIINQANSSAASAVASANRP